MVHSLIGKNLENINDDEEELIYEKLNNIIKEFDTLCEFTNLEVDEIDKIKNTEINELKTLLANNATKMLHGEDEAKKCEASAKETFSNNALGDTLPSVSISKKQLDEKINIVELIILSKLENSKSEARRLIKGNGVKINSQIIDDEKMIVTKKLFNNNLIKLSLGKKRHIKVKLS